MTASKLHFEQVPVEFAKRIRADELKQEQAELRMPGFTNHELGWEKSRASEGQLRCKRKLERIGQRGIR